MDDDEMELNKLDKRGLFICDPDIERTGRNQQTRSHFD